LSCDPASPSLGHDEDVLDLGNAQMCADPSDMGVPDGLIMVPCDEVGRSVRTLLVETVKWQASIDITDLARLELSHSHHGREFHTPLAGAGRA
jgi:hypothetical protein